MIYEPSSKWWLFHSTSIMKKTAGMNSNSLLPQLMPTLKPRKILGAEKWDILFLSPKNLMNFARVWLKMVSSTKIHYILFLFFLFFQATWVFCWPGQNVNWKYRKIKTSLDWAAFLHPKVHICYSYLVP